MRVVWVPCGGVSTVRRLFLSEEGQDLIEYSLLLAFVVLVGAAAFIGMGKSTNTIWTVVNTRLANASGP